jgi:dTDP-4-dehydrorhamnose 3,5-epimerase
MQVTETSLPGLVILEPQQYSDDRGFFMETFNERVMGEHDLPTRWCQDNYSYSKRKVIRGLHYQISAPQGKLVRVLFGAALDVAVDLRKSSPTFGRHAAIELRAEQGTMLYIPAGFAHGFAALTEGVGFAYKVTDYYCAAAERTILWNDPELAIDWPFEAHEAIVSAKDRVGVRFADAETFA